MILKITNRCECNRPTESLCTFVQFDPDEDRCYIAASTLTFMLTKVKTLCEVCEAAKQWEAAKQMEKTK